MTQNYIQQMYPNGTFWKNRDRDSQLLLLLLKEMGASILAYANLRIELEGAFLGV